MRLTVKTYPKEWNNEDRINNVYAPFKNKALNPIDYESKMKFWRTFINSTLKECKCCSFTLEELEKAFVHNGRKPLCLRDVIDNMLSEGDVNYLTNFEELVPSEDSWTNWAVKNFISSPIKWSFCKLKDSFLSPTPTCYDKRFVHLSTAKNLASELLSKIGDDLRGVMITKEEILNAAEDSVHESDLDTVLHWLELQGLAAVTTLNNKKLVKFAEVNDKIKQISDADKAVFSLKQNRQELMSAIENLEVQKKEAIQEAQTYLKKGMRPMAKSCLRQKKELEKQIDKRITALDNIHVLLTRIDDTDSNTKVFESYKVSVSALKNQFKEAGLSEDNVSNTVAQVQEVLDIHEEIQSMLGEPAGSSGITSDEDYETELEDLLRNKEPQKQREKEFKLTELDLPEPPSDSPSSAKPKAKAPPKQQPVLSREF